MGSNPIFRSINSVRIANPMTNCPHCKSEVQPNWKACPACGERLPEMVNCRSCGAVLQPGWKACPECGNRVQGEQGSSFDITDSAVLIKQTDESQTKVEEAEEKFGSEAVDIEMLIRLANADYELGEYKRAIANLDQAIQSFPTKVETLLRTDTPLPSATTISWAYCNRGVCYGKLEDHQQAIQDYDEAINWDPQEAKFYNNRGYAYGDLGQYERAIQDYDEAIRLDPQDVKIYYNRGYAYEALGQYERAIQDYDEAIRLDPQNANAYSNRGYAYDDLGQYERAIQDYDEAIRLDPQDAKAYNNRGYAYYNLGQYERAIQDYDEAIRLWEEWDESLLSEVTFKEKGLEILEQYPIAYGLRGFAYREIGKSKEARQDLEKSAELGNSSAIEFLAQNPTTSKYTSKWGWFKSNFGGEAAQRRQAMNPLNQLALFKDTWGEIKELRAIKGIDKSGKESNDQDSDGKPRK